MQLGYIFVVSEPTQLKALSYPSKETYGGQYFVSNSMYIFNYKKDIVKDKPIDERGIPEILFEAAADVDRVAPLASLGAVEGRVRGGNSRQERHPGQLDEQCCPCSKGGTTFIKIKDWIRRFNRLKLMLKALRKSTLKQRGSREGAIPVTKRSFKSQVRFKRRSGNLSKIMREEEDLLRQDRQELYQLSTDKDKEPEETLRTSSLVRNEAVSLQIVPSTDNQP